MKSINMDPKLVEQIAEHYRAIIQLIGEDPEREGLLKTPTRAAKALLENTRGYAEQPAQIIQAAMFDHEGSEIVIVKDIEFYSLCEHHLLPFFGKISIGYIPSGQIVGLSKLGRIVDSFSRRFQVQERLTAEICHLLAEELSDDVIVVCEASHMCMQMRGVEKQGAKTVSMHYSGVFEKDLAMRAEFLSLIK
jgi:GTP cyclohydrolase I